MKESAQVKQIKVNIFIVKKLIGRFEYYKSNNVLNGICSALTNIVEYEILPEEITKKQRLEVKTFILKRMYHYKDKISTDKKYYRRCGEETDSPSQYFWKVEDHDSRIEFLEWVLKYLEESLFLTNFNIF